MRPPTLRYEDVCDDPRDAQAQVAGFLGLYAADAAQAPVTDWGRTNALDAFGPEARRVWSICGRTARALGYEADEAVAAS